MKSTLRFGLVLSALAVIFAVSSVSYAQIKVGGYKAVSVEDAMVVEAADFAVGAQSEKIGVEIELGEIVKAERQVVQGSNYRLCMLVSSGGDEAFYVQAVVYQDLKRAYKLTSWADSPCGEGSATTGMDPAKKGFKPVEDFDNDAGVDLAAKFAVREQAKTTKTNIVLGEIVKVEDQEPNLGYRNFRLCMNVTTKRKPSMIESVVSMDQYSNFKLVSWKPSTCN